MDKGVATLKQWHFLRATILKLPSVPGHPRGLWTTTIARWEGPGRKYEDIRKGNFFSSVINGHPACPERMWKREGWGRQLGGGEGCDLCIFGFWSQSHCFSCALGRSTGFLSPHHVLLEGGGISPPHPRRALPSFKTCYHRLSNFWFSEETPSSIQKRGPSKLEQMRKLRPRGAVLLLESTPGSRGLDARTGAFCLPQSLGL